MAINDIYAVTLRQRLHAQVCLNVSHWRETATGTGNGALVLAQDIVNVLLPLQKSVQSAELTYEGVQVQKIYPLPATNPIINTTGNGTATVGGSSLPTSVAGVITKRTNFAGRKYRGRVFVAGVPVGSENDSQLSAGVMTAWQILADSYALNKGTSGWTWSPVIWHRVSKTSDDVIAGIARQILRNQRRRQVGRGE